MIGTHRCSSCRVTYEVTWDDNEDAYYQGVEDTDKDVLPPEALEVEYCPFCGTHWHYLDEEEADL